MGKNKKVNSSKVIVIATARMMAMMFKELFGVRLDAAVFTVQRLSAVRFRCAMSEAVTLSFAPFTVPSAEALKELQRERESMMATHKAMQSVVRNVCAAVYKEFVSKKRPRSDGEMEVEAPPRKRMKLA